MTQRYVKVPYELINLEISNESKCAYIALMHFRTRNKKQIIVSMEKISEIAGIKERQLCTHIGVLCRNHMISRKQMSYGMGEFGCNIYTIKCNEKYFAEIPWDIAFSMHLTAFAKIAYCIMKQHINLKKGDFTCYLEKEEFAQYLRCTTNQVDKIKQNLKQAAFIKYERGRKGIVLIYEKNWKIFHDT